MIDRFFEKTLTDWKSSFDRRPMIIRGARQVGKTHTVREFGKKHFRNFVELNLEEHPKLSTVFSSLDPERICAELSVVSGVPITPGESLLFIDELQQSSEALLSLRYFYEKMPKLHVIAAGSLLDFMIDNDRELRIPVGRVEYAFMHPLTFSEFLLALGENTSHSYIASLKTPEQIPESIHAKLLDLFRQYIACGGMPAVVRAYQNSKSDLRYRQLQADLLKSYRDDFRKYRSRVNNEKLEEAFEALGKFAARDFNFNDFCPDFSIASTKRILTLFRKARLISPVRRSLGQGLPLGAQVKGGNYKYIFLDVGLLNMLSGTMSLPSQWNLELFNSGAVAEQIVGQELLNLSEEIFEPELFFWKRDKPGSEAEVDYLYPLDGKVIPIEVKAGSTGRLRSLRIFIDQMKIPFGVRISQHNLSYHDQILSIPFYALSQLKTLCRAVRG